MHHSTPDWRVINNKKEVEAGFSDFEDCAVIERMWLTQDSQGQILAVAFRYGSRPEDN